MILIVYLFLLPIIICEWSWGWCPSREKIVLNNTINLTEYSGNWYEIKRTLSDSQIKDCISSNYTITDDSNMLVNSRGYYKQNDSFVTKSYTLRKTDRPFEFKEEILPFLTNIYDREYIILNTDYDNYSIVYSCYDAGFMKDQYVWILSRKPEIDNNLQNNLTTYIYDKTEISPDKLIDINQNTTLCKY